MNLFLGVYKPYKVIKLPIAPSEYKLNSPQNNEKFEAVNGDLYLPGKMGLKTLTIDSFFPFRKYSFSRTSDYKGYKYVNLIEKWRKSKQPIRVTISNSPISILMLIDSFDYGVQDGTRDVYYSMSLTEFKEIKLKKKKVK